MTNTVSLNDVAEAVAVHPRTILRIVTGDRNTYWSADHNPGLDITKVAQALGCHDKTLARVLRGSDDFLKPDAAASELGVPGRTFRYREYTPTIKVGRVVRFARSKLIDEHFARWA